MDSNRKAVLAGAAVTAVTTVLLWAVPYLLPFEAIRQAWFERTGEWMFDRPFRNLRFLGALPGGFVAGYLARDKLNVGAPVYGMSVRNGIFAGLGGIGVLYLLYVAYQLVRTAVIMGMFPPPIYLIVVVPLVLVLPFVPAFAIEGLLTALIGHVLYQRN